MKKLLAFFAFLSLGSIQFVAGQSQPSQFSVPSSGQQGAQANTAAPHASSKLHSAQSHPYLSNPPVNPVGFVSATQISAGGAPKWTAVSADFNSDGKSDFATPVLNPDGSTFSIAVVLSNGDGTFQPVKLTANPKGNYGDAILTGDFNEDGKPDLLLVHATNPSTFEVWLGNGDGTFNVGGNATFSIGSPSLDGGAVADITGDKHLDLVIIDGQTPANMWTVMGNGNGTFHAPTSLALTGGKLNDIVFDDFNGDNLLDFAASDTGSNNQTVVYLAQKSGGYVASAPLTTAEGQYGPCNNASGDLNGDGKSEIVTSNCGYNNLIVYVNNGDGTFKQGVPYAAANNASFIYPQAVTIADVNGDGKKDIVSSNSGIYPNTGGSDITILMGIGDGTFDVPSVGYSTGGSPRTSAIVADFNGHGVLDVVIPDGKYSFAYLPGLGDGSFRSAVDYFSPVPDNSGGHAQTIATADLNGDGYPDLVVGNCCDGTLGITVFLSTRDGSMQPGTNYGSSGSLASVVIADFNGDKILDIAALNITGDSVQIFKGNGDGTFTESASYPTSGTDASGLNNGPFVQMVTADFNHDGHPDLAIANFDSQNVSVVLNDGSGGFHPASIYALPGNGQAIALADVNNDGVFDLVVTGYSTPGSASVLLGVAGGTFQAAANTPLLLGYNLPGNIALADLDGDGKADLVVTVDDPVSGTGIAVAKGNGDGTFQTAVFFSTTLQSVTLAKPVPGSVQIADLNGDGKLDLVYSNANYGTIGVLYNTGTNAFAAGMFYDPVEYPAGANVYSLALADVNHDGAVDVVMADEDFVGVTVLLNASGSSSALASSANPAIVSQSITFTATLAAKVRGVPAVPSGNVTFMDGSTAIGTVPLSGGVASLSTTTLAIGTHTITAQYAGDSNFHSSTSTAVSEVVTATPDFSLGATTPKVTVTAGNSGQINFSLTSNGYTGSVTFTCLSTTVPSKADCSFNPASLALVGNNTLSTTLTISTTAATTASLAVPARPDSNPVAPTLWASLSGVGLFGLVWAGGASKKRRHMVVVLGILLLIMMFTMLGCGGSGSSSTSNQGTSVPGTPAGSYTVTVVATGSGSGAPSHTMNVTLVVQ
jgi:hypothetical protein